MNRQKQINRQMNVTINNQNGAWIAPSNIEITSATNDKTAAAMAAIIITPKVFIRTSFVFFVVNKKLAVS